MSEHSELIAQSRELLEKATPGPWGFARADRNSGVRPWITQLRDGAANGAPICMVQPPEGVHALANQPFPDNHQIYDNARFIAAAPTLIDSLATALQEATQQQNFTQQHLTGLVESAQGHTKAAESKLAEAEGKLSRIRERLVCPLDTNGDRDCGRISCPICGVGGVAAILEGEGS